MREKTVAKSEDQIFMEQLEKIKQKEKERQEEPISAPTEVDAEKTKG